MPVPDRLGDDLRAARERTMALVSRISEADLERVHSALMSPLVWDLGHLAAYEDLWLAHRTGGRPLLRPDLAAVYDAFETPRHLRGETALLGVPEVREYLHAVRERSLALLSTATGQSAVWDMVVGHERQHNETMLQTIELARLPGWAPDPEPPAPPAPGGLSGLETVEVAGGPFELGARAERFAYDNERPAHPVTLPAFRIGRVPVSNATWLSFAEGGGYERREWWSDEGWKWKHEYDIWRPGGWSIELEPPPGGAAPRLEGRPVHEWRRGAWEPLQLDRPVVHVSWFEAEAFARAHGVRLPTESEWEKAARWDPAGATTRAWPWGEEPPSERHANLLESRAYGTVAVGALRAGAAPCGALGLIGDVWEWTASEFGGYPGFRAHPYREYSEVFFGGGYRVLRGGSWASSGAVLTTTFRNWDLPIRRQIFSGVRIATDA